jgi:RNA polymerase sigma factor for flagellar operon FliA
VITDPSAFDPQFQLSVGDLRAQLVAAIARLEERGPLVAAFYFYEGLNLKEIGKALNLTESRVSQVLRLALTKLREHLKGSPLAQGDWQQSPG